MTAPPKWLRRGPARRARLGVCQRCMALTVVGLDAEIAAIPAEVDYARLSVAGELLAIVAGRATYRLTLVGGRYELDPRRGGHITRASAADVVVLAEHICGVVAPAVAVHPERPFDRPPRGRIPDDPEF